MNETTREMIRSLRPLATREPGRIVQISRPAISRGEIETAGKVYVKSAVTVALWLAVLHGAMAILRWLAGFATIAAVGLAIYWVNHGGGATIARWLH